MPLSSLALTPSMCVTDFLIALASALVDASAPAPHGRYSRHRGELGPRYATAFARMRLETNDGNPDLVGPVADQVALPRLLDNIAALGLALVRVAPIDASDLA